MRIVFHRAWRSTPRTHARLRTVTALVLALPVALPVALPAQSAPADTAGLGSGPGAHMRMLLEKTIFKVDVLALDVRLGSRSAARVDSLLARHAAANDAESRSSASDSGTRWSRRALSDSIAALALDADEVLASIEFRRDVKLGQFLDGIRSSLEKAEEAGIIDPDVFRQISSQLPEWYASLEGRNIRSGDRMLQRIRGDTLRTVYLAASGETLLDQTDVGPERRLSVLGGYFAPGSDFRDKLIASVLEDD